MLEIDSAISFSYADVKPADTLSGKSKVVLFETLFRQSPSNSHCQAGCRPEPAALPLNMFLGRKQNHRKECIVAVWESHRSVELATIERA